MTHTWVCWKACLRVCQVQHLFCGPVGSCSLLHSLLGNLFCIKALRLSTPNSLSKTKIQRMILRLLRTSASAWREGIKNKAVIQHTPVVSSSARLWSHSTDVMLRCQLRLSPLIRGLWVSYESVCVCARASIFARMSSSAPGWSIRSCSVLSKASSSGSKRRERSGDWDAKRPDGGELSMC